jgi:hypothetical protein
MRVNITPEYKTLGRFNDDCAAIGKAIDARAEELKAAYQEIEKLKADLEECSDYFADRSDVVDGDYGEPAPNKEMRLYSMIQETLHGPGNF